MSLRRYFQHRDGLPDANGPLATVVPSRAIANANKEVGKVLNEATSKKRGQYRRLALYKEL